MAEPNAELGHAVADVLAWLGVSPETAGAALGINARTLSAMAQGIVPMRSLVIRFATGVARRCQGQADVQDWWMDVDAWLAVAGYTPRREAAAAPAAFSRNDPVSGTHSPGGDARFAPVRGPQGPIRTEATQRETNTPTPVGQPGAAPTGTEDCPAREHYHPVYERLPFGDTFVHVFWIVDREDRRTHQISMPASFDYKARAAGLKQDLASMTRTQFERKYGRFRVNGQR